MGREMHGSPTPAPPVLEPVEPRRLMSASYYVAAGGNDAADGLSPQTAWATIHRVNHQPLHAGDGVFFRGGDTFAGTLILSSSGASGNPIQLGSFGNGRATIAAGDNTGLLAHDVSGIFVHDLNFTGTSQFHPAPAATQLAQPAAAGDRAVNVADAAGLVPGQEIDLERGRDGFEVAFVARNYVPGSAVVTLDAPLQRGHAAGSTVNADVHDGLAFAADGAAQTNGVRIANVTVTGFGGVWPSAGISISGYDAAGGFDHVRIKRVDVERDGPSGIYVAGFTGYGAYANHDVTIDHVVAADDAFPDAATAAASAAIFNPHDSAYSTEQGIVVYDSQDVQITRSVAHDNGKFGNGSVGIWASASQRVTVEYCESYANRTGSTIDGDGFDLDGAVRDSVIQYCYSHDNDAAGFALYEYVDQSQVNAVLAAPAAAGAATLSLSAPAAGIQPGQYLLLDRRPNKEGVRVADAYVPGSLVVPLAQPLQFDHAAGSYVRRSITAPNTNNTIRFNVSENDGRRNGYGAIELSNDPQNLSSQMTGNQIYSNTVYLTPTTVPNTAQPSAVVVWGAAPLSTSIRDNLFVTAPSGAMPAPRMISLGTMPVATTANVLFQGNDYWASGQPVLFRRNGVDYAGLDEFRAATGQETLNGAATGVSVDPKLFAPGAGGTIGDADRLRTLGAYRLRAGSPVRTGALDLHALFGTDVGASDFYGNPIPNAPRPPGIGANTAMAGIPAPWLPLSVGDAGATAAAANTGAITLHVPAAVNAPDDVTRFGFACQTLTGDGAILARLQDPPAPGGLAGLMLRDSADPDAAGAFLTVNSRGVVRLRLRAVRGAAETLAGTIALPPGATLMRLQRDNGRVTAWAASAGDPVNWRLVGSASLALADQALVGLAATGGATSATSATFGQLSVLPGGVAAREFGAPSVHGSAYAYNGGAAAALAVAGAGTGIGAVSDQLHFVQQALTGDGSISALVSCDPGATAGLMIRAAMTPGAADAFVGFAPDGLVFRYRPDLRANPAGGAPLPPATVARMMWLKLARAGSTVTGYASADGENWTTIGSASIPLGATANVGFAVASGRSDSTASALFRDSHVVGGAPAAPVVAAFAGVPFRTTQPALPPPFGPSNVLAAPDVLSLEQSVLSGGVAPF